MREARFWEQIAESITIYAFATSAFADPTFRTLARAIRPERIMQTSEARDRSGVRGGFAMHSCAEISGRSPLAPPSWPRQAFTITYIRQGPANHWRASTKARAGLEQVAFTGPVSYSAARWEGQPEGEEQFATVTVLVECDPKLRDPSRVPDPLVIKRMTEEAGKLADQMFRSHHPNAVIEHDDEIDLIFPLSRDQMAQVKRGRMRNAVLPFPPGLSLTPGSEIVFVEATADPFGIPQKTEGGEHLMVTVIKSRDENYEWGGKRLHFVEWAPESVNSRFPD
jgi:hypothetical protein